MRTYLATWDRGAVRFTTALTGSWLQALAWAQVRLIEPDGEVTEIRDVTDQLRQDPNPGREAA